MIPIDLRPDSSIDEISNEENTSTELNSIIISVHDSNHPLFFLKVKDGVLSDEDLNLLHSSLQFMIIKFNEAIDYIKSKNETL